MNQRRPSLTLLIGLLIPCLLYGDIFFSGKNLLALTGVPNFGRDPWGQQLYQGTIQMLHELFTAHGWFTLWDPSESAGKPLLGDPHYKLLNVFQWLGIWRPTVGWLTFLTMLKVFISYFSMAAFLRKLRLSPLPCWTGAAFWIGNGYFTGYLTHNHFDVYFAIPILFWGVQSLLDSPAWKGFLGTSLGVYFLLSGGNPQPAIIALILAGGYFVSYAAWGPMDRRIAFQRLALGALAIGIVLLLLAPDILGLVELKRWMAFQDRRDLDPWATLPLIHRWLLPSSTNFVIYPDEGGAPLGFLPLVWIAMLLPWIRRDFAAKWFSLALLFSVYLAFEKSLIPSAPLRSLLVRVPVLETIRYSKYFEGLCLTLSVLLAFGMQALLDRLGADPKPVNNRGPRLPLSGLALALAGFLAWNASVLWIGRSLAEPGRVLISSAEFRHVYLPLWLSAWGLIIFLAFRRTSQTAMRVRNAFLFMAVLGLFASLYQVSMASQWNLVSREEARSQAILAKHPSTLVTRLRERTSSQDGPWRVFSIDNAFKPLLNNVYGINQLEGGNPIQLAHYKRFFDALIGNGRFTLYPGHNLVPMDQRAELLSNPMLGFLNIRYLVAGSTWTSNGIEERLPVTKRAFVVPQSELLSSAEEALERIRKDPSIFIRKALIAAAPSAVESLAALPSGHGSGKSEEVSILEYGPERIRLQTESKGPGVLILTDSYYPGWKATVNGRDTPIWLAQGAFRSLLLPSAGKFEIEFRYEPQAWRRGLILSAIGAGFWLLIFGLLLRNRASSGAARSPSSI